MGRILLTPEIECAICERYEQVERARILVDEFGVSDQTIYRVLKKHGIPRTHRHPKPKGSGSNHKNIDRNEVIELYRAGHSQTEIADRLGCSQNSVYYHLTKHGILKRRKRVSDSTIDEIEREYLAGASTYQLGEKYGVRHETISTWMRKRGHRRGKGCSAERTATCPRCHKQFRATRPNQTYCSQTCRNAAHWQYRDDEKRVNTDGQVEKIPLREIYDRDRGRCYICGGRTDWNDYRIVNGFKVCGPRYPPRDHVIALHNGGTHTRDNIRLACWECNSLKSDKGQMRLAI